MQLGKILGAGTLAALMAGSSIAFAATLADYPQPFMSSTGAADFLVVVGASAAPSDVVGAIDVAARLGSESYTSVATGGTTAGLTVSGEGKAAATANTKLYLNDTVGKSGLRNTMTKDELSTLLADGTVTDSNGTSYKYQQFIYLTPSDTSSTSSFRVQFDKPGAGGTEDPTYTLGKDVTTSPSDSTYFYRTTVSFDKTLPASTAVGQKIKLFGKEYTIHSDTTFTGTSKLVLAGGSDKRVLTGGEKVTATVGGKSYDVTFVGASSATVGVVKVGSEQKSVTRGTTQKIGGLDVYLDDVFQLSTTDQTQNSGSLLLGAEKLTLQNGSKAKKGDNEDSVDGTYVTLTGGSANDLSSFSVYASAKSSTADFVKQGSSMVNPLWGSFSLAFPSVTPAAKDGDKISIQNSGDNLLQMTFKDYRGNEKTVTWSYKATSAGSTFSLADSNGDAINVVENATVTQDKYFVVDAGEFAHIYEASSVNVDGTSSSSITLSDVMSGTSLTVTLGTDNRDQKVIDGQSYYFNGIDGSTDNFRVTWGSGAGFNETGTYMSVFPTVKTSKGARVAFTAPNTQVAIRNGQRINLPTGAVTVTTYTNGASTMLNLTAVAREDSVTSALASTFTGFNMSGSTWANFTLGRTTIGGLTYTVKPDRTDSVNVTVVGASTDAILTQPAVVVIEEKDDAGDEYSVVVAASTETSGSNNVAAAGTPAFTGNEHSATLGSNSDLTQYVDLWGAFAEKNSNGQDKVTIWYPDDQVTADIFVLASGATTSTTAGTSSTTVKQATAVKTAVARLDSEVGSTEKTTKSLVLVGGPAVNTLVAELAAAGKAWKVEKYREEGKGTAVIQLVADAFTSGKSALVVAGHSAEDTRAATGVLLKFDENTDKLKGTLAKLKNGVWTTESA